MVIFDINGFVSFLYLLIDVISFLDQGCDICNMDLYVKLALLGSLDEDGIVVAFCWLAIHCENELA